MNNSTMRIDKKVVTLVSLTVVALLLSVMLSFGPAARVPFADQGRLYGPAVLYGKQVQTLSYCATIDYVLTSKDVRGWPFGVIESAQDDCGAYYPWSYKLYVLGLLLNAALANGLVVGMYGAYRRFYKGIE